MTRNPGGKKLANLKDEIPSNDASDASLGKVDMKLEVVVIPVSDVDRAKDFYAVDKIGRAHV